MPGAPDLSYINNITLFVFSITALLIIILAGIVFLNDRKKLINKTFLFLSIAALVYGLFNYLGSLPSNFNITVSVFTLTSFKFLKLTIFSATWYAFAFFGFFYVLLKGEIKSFFYFLTTTLLVFVTSLVALSELTFKSVKELRLDETISKIEYGPGIIIFGLLTSLMVFGGLYFLVKKLYTSSGQEKRAVKIIMLGALITYPSMVILNFVLPVIFGNSSFVPYVSLITLPFLFFTAYAITRHQLFNVKIIATQLFIFLLWLVILIPTILSEGLIDWLVNGLTLMLTIVAGIFLIRSIKKEVDQRERIEVLLKELGKSNDRLWVANEKLHELDRQKTEFVSIASHQLRSPLTSIKGYSSMLLEGSFGGLGEKAREAVDRIFQSSQNLVGVIEDFLNISRIELGTMRYEISNFDLRKLAGVLVDEMRPVVEKNGLRISFESDPNTDYSVRGDTGKLTQVISNLIDNAIKYTKEGGIVVSLSKEHGRVRLIVADTGIGISPEAKSKLFQKFSRADDAGKINIRGTGLGLYVAKQIIEAHRGRIWAESAGLGKGSRFVVELETQKG